MRFWDSSALVPLCVVQPGTPAIQALFEADRAAALWWATPVECASAIARHRRAGRLEPQAERQASEILENLRASAHAVDPSPHIRDAAIRLLRLHPLGAGDALQLAAAVAWADGSPAECQFLSLDRRLREAAAREGFVVLPVELPQL